MALLRNYVRLWTRSPLAFNSQSRSAADLTSGLKKGSCTTPRMKRLQSDLPLNDRLRANEVISKESWATIRKEFMALPELKATESTVDMTIVHLCLDNEKVDRAMDYLQYLWDRDCEMNLSCMISYLKLCHTIKSNETRIEYLLNMYNKIRDKYSVMDALTAESCIMAITQTNRWKESIELMDNIKLSCKPRSVAYSALIAAAFNNNEPDIGWKYLREVLIRLEPDHRVYTAYLNYCTRNFNGDELQEKITKMFQLWGDMDVRPHIEVISKYEKVLRASGWIAEITSIGKFGVCCHCSHKLYSLRVTTEQYTKLTRTIRERVIIGDNVYKKTTPEELVKFLEFIKRVKPYDIVIDGLNVSYISSPKIKPDGSQLTNVVRSCVNMGKTVLVLGRKHMVQWQKLDVKYIKEHGDIFLADNSSADDPYLLYATLIRGPDTQFVSKDLMRQHKFRIEDRELMKIFTYWQMAHQFYPTTIKTNRGIQVHLKSPPTYLPAAQNDANGWHVPFVIDSSLPNLYEPPKSWVCFRKISSNSTDGLKLS